MFGRTQYIDWALAFYHGEHRPELDLGSSGMPAVQWSSLGLPAPDITDESAHHRFVDAIAAHAEVPRNEVIPTLGTSGALFLAYAAILSPGDEVLVETPGYEPLTRAAEGLGAIVRTFERHDRVVPEQVAAKMTPKTRAIVVTTLHNPSGVNVSDAEILELAKVAEAQGAYVIVDEVYAPFESPTLSGKSARRLAPNVIAISSLTKCWGLGALRAGWLVGPEAVVASARNAGISSFGHLPPSHSAYGAAALGVLPKLTERSLNLVGNKREIAEKWAASLVNARWSAPTSGLYGMLTLPGRGDLRERIEAMSRESKVLVGPGIFFGAPESFRLSWATPTPAQFEEGLSRLGAAIARW
jgi:aspartate/methionine/tyrosine aminotransferase